MKERITTFLLWLLQRINRHKDTDLSWLLHDIADEYDTRPTGQWHGKAKRGAKR